LNSTHNFVGFPHHTQMGNIYLTSSPSTSTEVNSTSLPPPDVPNYLKISTTKDIEEINNFIDGVVSNLEPGYFLSPVDFQRVKSSGILEPGFQRVQSSSIIPKKFKYNFAVLGLKKSGKSSFINTICRVINKERIEVILHAHTAPQNTQCSTIQLETIYLDDENCKFKLTDCKHSEDLLDDKVQISEGIQVDDTLTLTEAIKRYIFHSFVLVLCPNQTDEDSIKKIKKLYNDIKKITGSKPIIVMSMKDTLSNKEIFTTRNYLREESNSDLVYCITNYISPPCGGVPIRRKDTERQVLQILEMLFREADKFSLNYVNNKEKFEKL